MSFPKTREYFLYLSIKLFRSSSYFSNFLTISEINSFLIGKSYSKKPTLSLSESGRVAVFRLIPMPIIMLLTIPVSKSDTASVSIPHSFLPSRYMSFTHLIFVSVPVSSLIASTTQTAAYDVIPTADVKSLLGEVTSEKYNPVPLGE